MTPASPEADERLIERLRAIADASRRENGTDIPLGEDCRNAADALTAANVRIAEQAKQITVLMDALTEAAAVCAKWSGLSSKVARTLANGGAA